MPTSSKSLLKIDALSVEIGGRGILHNVSLEVGRTEWLAVVGGSGAGKSTLLRSIMGLKRPARPTSGHIYFDGHKWSLADHAAPRPKAVSLVPQSPAHGFDPLRRLNWQLSQLARRIGGQQTDRQWLLNTLALPDPGSRYPHEWSRGMQQRLLLAMALMDNPKLLVLDEPTSALDPVIAARVLQEVHRLAKARGIAVILVTHDLALAARYAKKIAIMEHGRIVESGCVETVLRHPRNSYARELVAHRHWSTSPARANLVVV